MTYDTFIIGLVCYALIGIATVLIGPVRRELDEAVADLRRAPSLEEGSDGSPVSETKALLFRAVLSVAIVLLWWRFLVFALRPHTASAHTDTASRIHGTAQR